MKQLVVIEFNDLDDAFDIGMTLPAGSYIALTETSVLMLKEQVNWYPCLQGYEMKDYSQ